MRIFLLDLGTFEFSTWGSYGKALSQGEQMFCQIRSLRNMTEGCHKKSEIKSLQKREVECAFPRENLRE